MTQNLTLVTQKKFGSLACNVYQGNENEFYMTREQIGTALNYSNPRVAIAKIHDKNADRLDSLSSVTKLVTVDGKDRDVTIYTLRGVMEICRLSRQPKADAFMDFVWDIMESLYHGNSVLSTPDQSSAIAMQTIQTLVDSVLKTQTETARAMVTMTSTLAALANHLSPTKTPAPQPVPNSSQTLTTKDAPPASKSELKPETKQERTVNPKTGRSSWCNKAYRTMDFIIKNAPEQYSSRRQILNIVYDKMKREYGFVEAQERKNYLNRHANPGYLPTIQVIEDSTTYCEIFESILRDIKNDSIIKHSDKTNPAPIDEDDIPIKVQEELGMIPPQGKIYLPHVKDECTDLDAQPVPEPIPETKPEPDFKYHTPAPSQSMLDMREFDIEQLVKKAGELYHDTSYNYNYTYRIIYGRMNCDWEFARQQFYHTYHRQANTNKALVCYSYALYQRFRTAAADYIKAASATPSIAIEATAKEV